MGKLGGWSVIFYYSVSKVMECSRFGCKAKIQIPKGGSPVNGRFTEDEDNVRYSDFDLFMFLFTIHLILYGSSSIL